MVGYLNDLEELFFTWCDHAVQDHINRGGTVLKRWRPCKNPDGSYDLVFELAARDQAAVKFNVPVPEEFHKLLECEYFINHPPK
ncbi:MAG: hypothetical protein A4E53_01602 [Pelotomaculum sp. PtaB.Bin104]|nr:MAG: hypothetical protein A4E53_01602 [Pelotomaculum sp. PtaB.Bin104]